MRKHRSRGICEIFVEIGIRVAKFDAVMEVLVSFFGEQVVQRRSRLVSRFDFGRN